MENNNNLIRAKELYNQAIDSFSYKLIDPNSGENRFYPVSYSEIKNAKDKIAEIENLQITDADFLHKIENLKSVCNNALKRKIRPSFATLIAVLIWVTVNVIMAYNVELGNLNGSYQVMQADSVYNKEIERHSKQVDYYKNESSNSNKDSLILYHTQKIETLKKITPTEFLTQQNLEIKTKAKGKLIMAAISLSLLIIYLISAFTPMFLIYRKRKNIQWAKEKNHPTNFLASVFTALWNVPDIKASQSSQTYAYAQDGTVDENGKARKIYQGGDMGESGNFLKYSLIAGLIIAVWYAMIVLLPLFILHNFMRNYLYGFWDKLFNKTQNAYDTNKVHINKQKRNLPEVEFKIGDTVLARFSADNYLYFATIENINNKNFIVCYYDGTKEEILRNDICSVDYAVQNLNVESNWHNEGLYYKCQISTLQGQNVEVLYEDGSLEKVSFEQLRFS